MRVDWAKGRVLTPARSFNEDSHAPPNPTGTAVGARGVRSGKIRVFMGVYACILSGPKSLWWGVGWLGLGRVMGGCRYEAVKGGNDENVGDIV